jgi:hypothetical protein
MAPHDSADAFDASMPQDLPTADALLRIADDCFAQGFVALAEHLATLADAHGAPADHIEAVRRRSAEARAVDAAAVRQGMRHDEFVIPSIERQADGTPSFLLPIPASTAGQAEVMQVVAQEVQGEGVDAELRVFLGAMIEPGDAVIDCDPGFGFGILSAATRHPGRVTIVSRAADDEHAGFLRRAFAANGLYDVAIDAPVESGPQSLGVMLQNPLLAAAHRVLIHAGQADDVEALLPELQQSVCHPRVAAIVWSIGSDDTTLRVASALAALGTQHFVVAVDADGTLLVPQHAMPGATIIVSLTAAALSERQAA